MADEKNLVGQKLRHCREACALSQRQVAEALHIDRSTYTKYESGASEPNLATIVRLSAIYNVDPKFLLPMELVTDDNGIDDLSEMINADSPIFQLNKDERAFMAQYRSLPPAVRAEMQRLCNNANNRAKRAKKIR